MHIFDKKIKGSRLFADFVDARGGNLRPPFSDSWQLGREGRCSIWGACIGSWAGRRLPFDLYRAPPRLSYCLLQESVFVNASAVYHHFVRSLQFDPYFLSNRSIELFPTMFWVLASFPQSSMILEHFLNEVGLRFDIADYLTFFLPNAFSLLKMVKMCPYLLVCCPAF